MIHHGDLFDVLPTLPEASLDACVTDPPYGIGFMGREWDTFKPEKARASKAFAIGHGDKGRKDSINPNLRGRRQSPAMSPSQIEYNRSIDGQRAFQQWTEQWAREVHRVLKPGAYLVVCGAPRSYHRMACGLEDAGFVIRDKFSYLFGQGFPKSHNFGCKCRGNAGPYSHAGLSTPERDVRSMFDADVSTAVNAGDEPGQVLFDGLSERGLSAYGNSDSAGVDEGREQSSVEGRELHRTREGLSDDPATGASPSTNERLRPGTHRSRGEDSRPSPEAERGSASQGPGPGEQRPGQSASLRLPSRTLDRGASDRSSRCERCGGLTSARGLGTALKPGHEPIALAWKPFKGTIADNYIKHWTAALNVDACRIETSDDLDGGRYSMHGAGEVDGATYGSGINRRHPGEYQQPSGRWPSNVLLDEEAAKMLDEQSGDCGGQGKASGPTLTGSSESVARGRFNGVADTPFYGDKGGASRFFYVAKPSQAERDYGTERNIHPTVKPVELMRWLVRLVTPINGTVLDPFTGSGTTGMACRYELRNFIGIEREAEYVAIAERRIAQCVPLFGEATA